MSQLVNDDYNRVVRCLLNRNGKKIEFRSTCLVHQYLTFALHYDETNSAIF